MRALLISLSIALLVPLKGWSGAADINLKQSSRKSAFSCVIGELSEAVELYQRSPIEEAHLVTPQLLGIPLPSLFVQEAKTRKFHLSPDHYETLFTKLQTSFDHHKKGLLLASSANEADQLSQYLSKTVPGKTFASIHSGLSKEKRDSIRALYEKGKVNFLVVEKELDDPKLYGGMDLYVDLNRDFDTQRFLRGASHVLASDKNVRQAAIISLSELSPDHAIDQLISFEEAVEKVPSNPVRAELLNLSTEMQRSAIPEYASIEKVADETIEHILLVGEVPKNSGESEEVNLYQRMNRRRRHQAFIARIKRNPSAWKVFSDYLLTPPERAALDAIPHFLKGKLPPTKDPLYERIRKFRDDPAFIAKVKENPKAWEFFQTVSFRKPKSYKTALTLPSETAIVKKTSSAARRVQRAIEKAAQDLITHLLLYREMPNSKDHWVLYRSLYRIQNDSEKGAYRYIEDPLLLAKVKENPEAWEIFQSKSQPMTAGAKLNKPKLAMSALDKAAQGLIDHLLQYREMPTLETNKTLYGSIYRYRKYFDNGSYRYIDDPAFIAKIKENPEAWEIFQYVTKPKSVAQLKENREGLKVSKTTRLSPPQRIAKQVIVYILREKRLPLGESDIYERFHLHRDDPAFIQTIKENPEAWKLYSKLIQGSPSPQEMFAQDFIAYVSTIKAPLRARDMGGLYDRFLRYQGDPFVIAKLQENPKAWDSYQTLFKRKKKKMVTAPMTPIQAAQRIIVYMLKHNDVPPPDSTLFTTFDSFRTNRIFIKEIKANPKAWEIYSLSKLPPQERAARLVMNYIIRENKPLSSYRPIEKLFYRYRNDSLFIATITENSEVVAFLKKLGIKLKNPIEPSVPAP